jgi:ubiquinone/menaquinone biosynthesis C-methylase UbiE
MTYHSGNQLIDPQTLFEAIGLGKGMHIADFGSGRTGSFVFPAAAIVGEHGVVYAVDVVKSALEGIAKRARLDGLLNIHTVWADIERANAVAIPEHSQDAILLVNVLSTIRTRDAALTEADRILKPGGVILVVDWRDSTLSFAPAPEAIVDWNGIRQWAAQHHYAVADEFPAGKHHIGLLLRRPDLL